MMTEVEVVLEMQKMHAEVVKDLGVFGLQALITINAGAVIALITFIPQAIDSGKLKIDIKKIKAAVLLFLIGLFMAFLSILVTYMLAQMSFANFGVPSFWLFILLMVLPALLSFVCFAWGALKASQSIKENLLL